MGENKTKKDGKKKEDDKDKKPKEHKHKTPGEERMSKKANKDKEAQKEKKDKLKEAGTKLILAGITPPNPNALHVPFAVPFATPKQTEKSYYFTLQGMSLPNPSTYHASCPY
jgi:hypothetical protein